jgi:hypothetical protein
MKTSESSSRSEDGSTQVQQCPRTDTASWKRMGVMKMFGPAPGEEALQENKSSTRHRSAPYDSETCRL